MSDLKGIDVYSGLASFQNEKEVLVGEQSLKGENFVIATGSQTLVPKFIKGYENLDTSEDYFQWDKLPKSVGVIGGGYIAIDLGQAIAAMGSKVTVFLKSQPLASVDPEIVEILVEHMKGQGIDFQVVQSKEVRKDGDLKTLVTDKGEHSFEKLLTAIGRVPALDELHLDMAGVEVDHRAVVVDQFNQTSQKNIFAIGDAINKQNFSPVAIREGRLVAERLFGENKDVVLDRQNVPSVMFCHPPIGTVGLSESEAVEKYGDRHVKVYRSRFASMHHGMVAPPNKDRHQSLFKMICHVEPKTGKGRYNEKVVGVHAIGRGIDEMIQHIGVAVKMGATKQDFENTVAVHPTSAQEFVLMDPQFEV